METQQEIAGRALTLGWLTIKALPEPLKMLMERSNVEFHWEAHQAYHHISPWSWLKPAGSWNFNWHLEQITPQGRGKMWWYKWGQVHNTMPMILSVRRFHNYRELVWWTTIATNSIRANMSSYPLTKAFSPSVRQKYSFRRDKWQWFKNQEIPRLFKINKTTFMRVKKSKTKTSACYLCECW